MKMIFGFCLVLASQVAFAQAPATGAPPNIPAGEHPCMQIRKACIDGKYLPHEHKANGHGLWIDCFDPILAGKAVPGVTTPGGTIVSDCIAKKANWKGLPRQSLIRN